MAQAKRTFLKNVQEIFDIKQVYAPALISNSVECAHYHQLIRISTFENF